MSPRDTLAWVMSLQVDALVDTEVAISGTLPGSGNPEPGLEEEGTPWLEKTLPGQGEGASGRETCLHKCLGAEERTGKKQAVQCSQSRETLPRQVRAGPGQVSCPGWGHGLLGSRTCLPSVPGAQAVFYFSSVHNRDAMFKVSRVGSSLPSGPFVDTTGCPSPKEAPGSSLPMGPFGSPGSKGVRQGDSSS